MTAHPPSAGGGPAPDGLDLLLAAAVILGALAILGLTAYLLPLEGLKQSGTGRLAITVALLLGQNMALLAGIGAVALRRAKAPWRLLGLEPLPVRRLLFYAVAGAVTGIALGLLLQLGQIALGQPPRTPGAAMLAPAGFSWIALALMLLVGGILAPVAEEMVFRGLLFGWLRRRLALLPAALLSALPFGLVHMEIQHMAYAAAAGLILALFRHWAGSLWAPIVAHVTINAIAIAYVYGALADGVAAADI